MSFFECLFGVPRYKRVPIYSIDGQIVFYVINRPLVPKGYYTSPESTSYTRIYRNKDGKPTYIYLPKSSFHDACATVRVHVYRELTNLA